jgi:hypothetical protein
MPPPPKCPHNPDLELAIQAGYALADLAERGRRAPAAEVARLRDILARLAGTR